MKNTVEITNSKNGTVAHPTIWASRINIETPVAIDSSDMDKTHMIFEGLL